MNPVSSRFGTLDGARPINWGSRLTEGLKLWFHFGFTRPGAINAGLIRDLTRLGTGVTQVWLPNMQYTRDGSTVAYPGALRLVANGPYLQIPHPTTGLGLNDLFTNPTECTILLVYRHRDTTNRMNAAFGVDPVGGSTFPNMIGSHLPWSDGKIYWDFGENAGGLVEGANRLSFAYTKDLLWHWWAFVVGGGQGKRVYRDGILLGSDSGTPTRNVTNSSRFYVGNNEFNHLPDNADLSEVVGFDRAMSPDEVVEWARQSRAGHPDTLAWFKPHEYLFFGLGEAPGGTNRRRRVITSAGGR